MPKIILDCEKMRFPNTGFAETCMELSKALLNYERNKEISFQFLLSHRGSVPEAFIEKKYFRVHQWRKECFIKHVRPLLYPFFDKKPSCIWHITTQMAKYLPLNPHIPKVLTINDLNFLRLKTPEKASKKLKEVRYLAKQSDYITTISHYVAREVRQHIDTGDTPLKVVYLAGSNFDDLTPKPPGSIPKAPFLFTISTLRASKNIHVLIPFLKEIKTYFLIIAGEGDAIYLKKLKELAFKHGVENRVFFTGPVSQNKRLWLYQHCSAFLFPSLTEGFGIPVLDALRFAKPVFLSDKTSLPEIAGDTAWYWKHFDPDYMKEIFVRGMKEYEDNKESMKKKMIQRSQHFNWEKTAKEYIDIYLELSK